MKALLLAPMGSVHRRFNAANIKALQQLGYEVHLLANFQQGEGTEQQNPEYVVSCNNKGIIAHSIPYQRHSLKANFPLIKPTREVIEEENFDLIHGHTETGGLILRMVGKTRGKKIFTPHGMSFYKGAPLKTQLVYRPIEKWICSEMNLNIAINQEELKTLRFWDKDTAALTHGIGLDIERFNIGGTNRSSIRAEFGIPDDAQVVLSVGELDDNKNHATVIRALHGTDAYYLICGIGPNEDSLKRIAQENSMGSHLILAGYRRDIPDIIAACDIFAFPSFHEGMPVSLCEAMAGGLPVVCSRIRGNVDLVKNGINGYLVDPDDIAGWTYTLTTLLADENLRQTFQENALSSITDYSHENVTKELYSLYRKVSKQ